MFSMRLLTVAFDDARGSPFHHVDGRFVLGHVMAKLRRFEHHVVAQIIGLGEAGVVVGRNRLPGKVCRNIKQADGHFSLLACAAVMRRPHFIQAGVTGKPLWCRYSTIALRFFISSRWPGPNMSQKSPTHTGRCGGAVSG